MGLVLELKTAWLQTVLCYKEETMPTFTISLVRIWINSNQRQVKSVTVHFNWDCWQRSPNQIQLARLVRPASQSLSQSIGRLDTSPKGYPSRCQNGPVSSSIKNSARPRSRFDRLSPSCDLRHQEIRPSLSTTQKQKDRA